MFYVKLCRPGVIDFNLMTTLTNRPSVSSMTTQYALIIRSTDEYVVSLVDVRNHEVERAQSIRYLEQTQGTRSLHLRL